MSTFQQLQQDLDSFWQLPYHQNPALAQTLSDVQNWQRARILLTHHTLFADPKHQAMGEFLINQLYGGETFNHLTKQLGRMSQKAEKLEKFIPKKAVETGMAGITEAITAIKLDLQLAQFLYDHQLDVNETNMLTAYRTVNAQAQRVKQIANLRAMSYQTDKYIKSFVLQKAFALAKGTAYRYQFDLLYDFVAEGFNAIKPIGSVGAFIEPFCQKEWQIIDNVHTGKTHPFNV